MLDSKLSRRAVFKASTALAVGAFFAEPIRAAAPTPSAVTPGLIEAARKEGKIAFYTALDLQVAEKLGKTFEARYPGIAARIERSGAERVLQRIGQEQASHINAVDVACSTDAAHFLFWKRSGWLTPYLPEEAAMHFPTEQIDADGMYATVCAWLIVIGYNTKLVKPPHGARSISANMRPSPCTGTRRAKRQRPSASN